DAEGKCDDCRRRESGRATQAAQRVVNVLLYLIEPRQRPAIARFLGDCRRIPEATLRLVRCIGRTEAGRACIAFGELTVELELFGHFALEAVATEPVAQA